MVLQMRSMLRSGRLSPSLIISILALIVALAGTAVAGGVLNKKKVKKISRNVANKQIDTRAPGLTVSHAGTANSAGTATNADHAGNADSAGTANNASQLGGIAPGGYERTVRWAVIVACGAPGGTCIQRGSATGADREGTGAYLVSFAPDIRNCAYLATDGDPGAGDATTAHGEITVEQFDSTNATIIRVRHFDSAGAAADYPLGEGFHIAVLCP